MAACADQTPLWPASQPASAAADEPGQYLLRVATALPERDPLPDAQVISGMVIDDDKQAAPRLAGRAHEVGRTSVLESRREALPWMLVNAGVEIRAAVAGVQHGDLQRHDVPSCLAQCFSAVN